MTSSEEASLPGQTELVATKDHVELRDGVWQLGDFTTEYRERYRWPFEPTIAETDEKSKSKSFMEDHEVFKEVLEGGEGSGEKEETAEGAKTNVTIVPEEPPTEAQEGGKGEALKVPKKKKERKGTSVVSELTLGSSLKEKAPASRKGKAPRKVGRARPRSRGLLPNPIFFNPRYPVLRPGYSFSQTEYSSSYKWPKLAGQP